MHTALSLYYARNDTKQPTNKRLKMLFGLTLYVNSESLNDDITIGQELSHNRLDLDRRRKRRDVNELETTTTTKTTTTTTTKTTTTPAEITSDSNISSEVTESDILDNPREEANSSNNSNNSQEHYDEAAPTVTQLQKFSSKISQQEINKEIDFSPKETDIAYEDADYVEINEDNNDTVIGESKRRPRQLRPFPHASPKWPANNYRSIDTPTHQSNIPKSGYSFGSYNPYLTPPNLQSQHTNHNYNQLSPNLGYKVYPQQQHHCLPV